MHVDASDALDCLHQTLSDKASSEQLLTAPTSQLNSACSVRNANGDANALRKNLRKTLMGGPFGGSVE